MRWRALIFGTVLLVTALAGGCSYWDKVVELDRGYFFYGRDVLAAPGQQVTVTIELSRGRWLDDSKNVLIRYFLDNHYIGKAITDDEGVASLTFTPPQPGDYIVFAECHPKKLKGDKPLRTYARITCREPETPLFFTDLDWTLAEGGIPDMLNETAMPMPDSVAVLNRLSKRYTIVYLTARVTIFGPRSKRWLWDNGYPRGPVYFSQPEELLGGFHEFKAETLAGIRKHFSGPGVGAGDAVSDVKAYADNDIRPILLLSIHDPNNPHDYRKLAKKMDKLPPGTQPAKDWLQVERIVLERETYTPSQARQWLLQEAKRVKAEKKRQDDK